MTAGAAWEFAYIGPGAGIALFGSFLGVFLVVVAALFALITWPVRRLWRLLFGREAYRRARVRRVVIVGLDGLEPTLAERWMGEGRLPNLARLRAEGTYARLGTTCPPLSPVAWASFSTGTNPGKHDIFDFLTRTPADYRPAMSSVRIRPPRRTLRIGRRVFALSRPELTLLRRSKPFWSVLSDAGIYSAVLRVPITFPPERFLGVQLSAMCAPDLRGTQGMHTHFVEGREGGSSEDVEGGGDRIPVERRDGVVRTFLRGPRNPLRADQPELRLPIEVRPARGGAVRVRIDGRAIRLRPGQMSDWVTVSFRAGPGTRLSGICRLRLKRFDPPFEMYCSPIHIDPARPVMPISHPAHFAAYLHGRIGPFATLGIAEDTGSLSEGVISEDEFLKLTYDVHAERERMFFDVLRRVRRGMIACVFDAPDRIQHMFWRSLEKPHARGSPSPTNAIPEMYRRMDALVGRIAAKLRPDDALIVLSDHGFHPFRRCVDLNAWLRDNGYLKLRGGSGDPKRVEGVATSERPYLADVDWSGTRAYALGLAGIFINQKGREGQGIVDPGDERRRLVGEISRRLTGLRDAERGEVAVHEAIPRGVAYRGPYLEDAPDVIVGYASGYRVSWDAAVGKCGPTVFSDNVKPWSGDHCIHPDLVPGVLFSNLKLRSEGARIIDLAPTVLDLFGVPRPEYMDGASLAT